MKRYILILLLVVAGGGFYYYQMPAKHFDIEGVSFTLIDGRRLSMAQLRGQPVLVTFWATSCVMCIKEIPDLIKLYKKYTPKGLKIIAVAMPYDRPDHVVEMVKLKNLPYPVALDIDAQIVRSFNNVRVTPNHFLIAPDGSIIKHQIGILDLSKTEKLLLKYFNGT